MPRDSWLRRWWLRRRADSIDARLDEEIQFHLDREMARNIEGGMTPAQARRAAFRTFGPPESVKARTRDEFRLARVRDGLRNLRLVARGLWRNPGFTATSILTLAFGIGAVTAIFSVVYGVILKPLPFYDPARLVAIDLVTPASQTDAQPAAAYFTYRENGRVFEDVGAWQSGNVLVARDSGPEQVLSLRVTDGTLSLLGVKPELGRLIGREDDASNAPLRVLLTHAYSQRMFGASTGVLGKQVAIDGRPYEIVGVLPASFKFPAMDPQLVLPLRLNRAKTFTGGGFGFNVIARLKTGVAIDEAGRDVARMIPLIPAVFPFGSGLTQEIWDSFGLKPNVRPLSEAVIGDMGRPLWILLGAVGVVLVLAWANVANLLLVRAEGRRREFVVRAALGASRRRIAGDLLSETLVLGLCGGACGTLCASAAIGLLRRIAPAALPRVDDIDLNAVVLIFTFATSIVTSLLFGLIPVARCGRLSVDMLHGAGRSSTDAPGRHRTRSVLVVVQVALAMVLLVVSGLMARTFVAMRQVQPGFVRPAEVQTLTVSLPPAVVRDPERVAPIYKEMFLRLQSAPGVTSVGLGTIRMDGLAGKAPVYVEGRTAGGLPPIGSIWQIGAGYFETLGNPVIAGRTITWADIDGLRVVAVISENLAREYWGEPKNAIGQRIGFYPDGPWLDVLGVVGNTRANGLNQPPPRLVYTPMANRGFVSRGMTFLVRSRRASDPRLEHELEHLIRSVNPGAPLTGVRTLEEIAAGSMAQTSFALVMLAIATGGALLLALVGIYGVVSYIAVERTEEIGIRMALGAGPGDVRGLFVRRGVALVLTGTLLGIASAMLMTPVMSALLYDVAPTDPITYAGVAVVLAIVTLVATYLPARRASRMAPVEALRSGR